MIMLLSVMDLTQRPRLNNTTILTSLRTTNRHIYRHTDIRRTSITHLSSPILMDNIRFTSTNHHLRGHHNITFINLINIKLQVTRLRISRTIIRQLVLVLNQPHNISNFTINRRTFRNVPVAMLLSIQLNQQHQMANEQRKHPTLALQT